MEGLKAFFIDTSIDMPYVHGSHNSGLVLLSILVSIFSATMSLQTAQIARNAENAWYRHVAISTGAIALGGGIWTMHFIGMLSFDLHTHVNYATALTLLSLLPACVASWFALLMLTRREVTLPHLVMSGTLVGLGIGTMHYIGMAAMQTSLQMRYDPLTFALSILLAISLAVFALWVSYGLQHTALNSIRRLLISGTFMGSAIAGMHYTGMAAVRFIGTPDNATASVLINATFASFALSTFTVTVTVLVFALNGLMHSRKLYQTMEENNLKIEDSKSRMRAILDTAVDGIITIDSHGLIQSFNHSAERLFGWTAEEVFGRNIKMLMPEPDQSRHDSYLHNYQTSGTPKIIGIGREVMGLRKDGSLMPMRLAVGRVDLPNELLFVGFVTDITERHTLEASLRETAERAERAATAKSTFLANMSHEIRTPMNSIIGFTELLLQGDLTSIQRNHLNTVRQSSRSLLGLINDILDTSKMEHGSLALEAIDFSLKGLALQIESSLRLGAHAKHLTLSTHYPSDMNEYFRGDPLRILQILTNLVGNAIKFTEHGRVDISFSHEPDGVHVKVKDTGIGMTPQQAESIFAPFTQADASISRRFGGTGLGTTIARQLVEQMSGRIEVESALGCGSTFHVLLPLPIGQKPAALKPATYHQALPPLKILIADDVAQNLELLTLTLGAGGHTIVMAHDGDEAVEKFRTEHFDLVLMDVHMPRTDGLQATRLIRQYERTHSRPHTPVIALTASVMAEDRKTARQAGMDGFAVKPLDAPRLFDEIAQVLNLERRPSSSREQDRTPPPSQLIDWIAGTSLWGSKTRLAKALEQFLSATAVNHPLPDEAERSVDWEATLLSLHSIHGAAGNLALPAVTELASTLEDMVRTGWREEARPQITQLRLLLQSAAKELQASEALVVDNKVPQPPMLEPELLAHMQTLLTCFEHSELNDAVLEKVCTGLESLGERAQVQALRTAVDTFELDHAHTLLLQLVTTHATEPQA
ncbi:MHYT domain-containing protein [Pseudomonas sp. MWU12-2037]|uniref:MHYT domain-containing protein n=1 Tax=Pseudomonas sp. MWU12-2037 TaxID=2928690 RepID=UPI0020108326|nr:MHYT domain-containing protein [Pseudomonas sp. MWU12-2037]